MSQANEFNQNQSPVDLKEIELSNLPDNNKVFETSPMNASGFSEP